jgi:pyrroloquinoline quinone biosynthesis protein B
LKQCLIAVMLGLSGSALAGDGAYLVVLGIAQDAGYPQTGCYAAHCMPGWEDPDRRRMASSIAVVDKQNRTKLLFDATPDMREQLYELHKVAPDNEYSLDGVFLTHAHMGHYTGLMHIGYESMNAKGIPVYAMPRMSQYLSANGPWDQLVRYNNIELKKLEDGVAVDASALVRVTPFRVPHRDEYSETVGYRIDGPSKSAIFIPDIDKWKHWGTDIRDLIKEVDYALVDATFYDGGELPGRDMSKVLHPFVAESMRLFAALSDEEKSRVIFIHMNHSNPLLQPGSKQRELVEANGFRIAEEGLKLGL